MRVWIKESPFFGVLRVLIFPIIWLGIFGHAFGGTIDHVPIALVVEDTGLHANEFINLLQSGKAIEITANTNYAHALNLLKNGEVTAVVIIPPEFSKNLDKRKTASIQLIIDNTVLMTAMTITSHLDAIQKAFDKQVTVNFIIQEGPQTSASFLANPTEIHENILYARGIRYFDYLAPGVIIMCLIFSAVFSGGLGLVMDRLFGTLRTLMVAPITRAAIILGKTSAGVTQTIIAGFVALFIAILMGARIKISLLEFSLIFLVITITSIAFIGMSVAFGTRIKEFEQFPLVMIMVVIPTWFLSGALYPIQSMPSWMKPLAAINPLTYSVDALRAVILRGVIWSALVLDLVIISGFALLMFIIGTLAFKRTIE